MEELQRARRNPSRSTAPLVLGLAGLLAGGAALGEGAADQKITPNFRDADLAQIAETVSVVTGKNFLLDPHVHAQVTMVSSTPLSPNAFYETFLAILQV